MFTDCIDVLVHTHGRHRYSSTPHLSFSKVCLEISIKGELDGFTFIGYRLVLRNEDAALNRAQF